MLEGRYSRTPEAAAALAHHSVACGELDKAYHYSCVAGRHAAAEHAFADASEFFARAISLGQSAGIAVGADVFRAHGDASFQTGRYALAEASFKRALDGLDEPAERAEILSTIAEMEYRRGNLRASAELHEQVLRTVGYRVPRRQSGVLLEIAKNALLATAHTARSPAPRQATRAKSLRANQVIARTCGSLTEVYYFDDVLRALLYNLVGLNTASEIGAGRELAQADGQQGLLFVMYGLPTLGAFFQARMAQSLEVVRSPVDHAWAAILRALYFAHLGQPDRQLAEARQARELLAKCPEPHRLREATLNMSEALMAKGELDSARIAALEVFRLAEELSDARGKGWGLYLLGVCASRRGDHTEAVSMLEGSVALVRGANDVLFELLAESRLAVELALHGALDSAIEHGLAAATHPAFQKVRYPYIVVDGAFLATAALFKQRDGVVPQNVKAAVRRVIWLRKIPGRSDAASMPLYLAGIAAWDTAHDRTERGIRGFARAVEFATSHGLHGELIHIHALGAKLLGTNAEAGRWHAREQDRWRSKLQGNRSFMIDDVSLEACQ